MAPSMLLNMQPARVLDRQSQRTDCLHLHTDIIRPRLPMTTARQTARLPTHRHAFGCAVEASVGFHHARLAATPKPADRPQLKITIRHAESDDELWACSRLRAASFYAYPPEREFAGRLHQTTMAKEEFKALRSAREQRQSRDASCRVACLMAVTSAAECPGAVPQLQLDSGKVAVGTLDLCNVRALDGEVLIGDSTNVAYLANVCVAEAARRCRVGETLISHARTLARKWGVDDMMVHIMAANESGWRFYESNGFAVLKEETPDQAHHRGHCLDGVSGGGRTVLLGDRLLLSD